MVCCEESDIEELERRGRRVGGKMDKEWRAESCWIGCKVLVGWWSNRLWSWLGDNWRLWCGL